MYVDGILCEQEDAALKYSTQPDPVYDPNLHTPPTIPTGLVLAYLDVWERHIGVVEDPLIREIRARWSGHGDARQDRLAGEDRGGRHRRRRDAGLHARRSPTPRGPAGHAGRARRADRRGDRSLHHPAGGRLSQPGEPALPGGGSRARNSGRRHRRDQRGVSHPGGARAHVQVEPRQRFGGRRLDRRPAAAAEHAEGAAPDQRFRPEVSRPATGWSSATIRAISPASAGSSCS